MSQPLGKTVWWFLKRLNRRSPQCASALTKLASIQEDPGSIPGLAQWVKRSGIAVSCGVGRRRDLDPTLLWLWCKPAATAPIRPLAWKPPYATEAALEKAKRQIKNKK